MNDRNEHLDFFAGLLFATTITLALTVAAILLFA